MPANYVLLEKITVGAAGASSVTFSSIPQTGYTDLVIKYSARVDAAANYQSMAMAFNGGSPSSAFTQRWINANAISVGSSFYGANTSLYPSYVNAASSTSSTFGNGEIYISNYSSTSQYKSVSVDAVTETNATDARSELNAMLWSSNNAVTSITLYGNTNFVANSTFYLYGVAKLGTTPAIVPYATGGDTIMTDGTYWYHAFLSSGTFTPAVALTTDYLVVAGGGGGSGTGGGGGGGFRTATSQPLSITPYAVTVGAGGAVSTSGSNSSFNSFSATGGGRGRNSPSSSGSVGGSGGGGSDGGAGAAGNAGSYSPVEGYAGGTSSATNAGGGGGGAGAVGNNGANSGVGGGGGIGAFTAISGGATTGLGQLSSGNYYFAGGGGGGSNVGNSAANIGGGGIGGNYLTSVGLGIANTGGGGGGLYNAGSEYATGGSGIVIIRYPVAS
jgi:hypothetical protein